MTPRELSTVAGLLLSAAPAVPMAPALSRAFYDLMKGKDWDEVFRLPGGDDQHWRLQEALAFWKDNLETLNGSRWKPPGTALHLRTDASGVGGGMVVVSSSLPSSFMKLLDLPSLEDLEEGQGRFPFTEAERSEGSTTRETTTQPPFQA